MPDLLPTTRQPAPAEATPTPTAPVSARGPELRGKPYDEQAALLRPERSGAADRPPAQFEVLGERFATLQEVHDHLVTTQPDAPEIVVRLTDGSPARPTAQTLWSYYRPHQKIVIDGVGRKVDGTHRGRPSLGYFLSYRPVVGEGADRDSPAAANLEVRNLTIRGFQSGGIEISPQRVAGDAGRWDGGREAFVSGAHIHGVTFKDLGSKHSPARETDWSKLQFGAGGLMMRGVSDSIIENNRFVGLENGRVEGAANGGKAGPQLMHAVYLNNQSTGNTIRNNVFDTISGDAVRVSNASHGNQVLDNRSRNAGRNALVSDWYNNSDPMNPQAPSGDLRIAGNDIGTLYGSKKKARRFHRKESQGQRPDLAV